MLIRLDKYLADMQVGTRSEVKELIRKKRVTVNDNIVTKPESKINTDGDSVNVDGNAVGYHEYEYFMLNKPAGPKWFNRDRFILSGGHGSSLPVLFRQLMTIHVQQ